MAEEADGRPERPAVSSLFLSNLNRLPLGVIVSWRVKGWVRTLRKVRKVAEGSENIDRRRWMRDESDARTLR